MLNIPQHDACHLQGCGVLLCGGRLERGESTPAGGRNPHPRPPPLLPQPLPPAPTHTAGLNSALPLLGLPQAQVISRMHPHECSPSPMPPPPQRLGPRQTRHTCLSPSDSRDPGPRLPQPRVLRAPLGAAPAAGGNTAGCALGLPGVQGGHGAYDRAVNDVGSQL